MAKNVSKLYYPIKESILSILPIVDEFIIALGNCDKDDNTKALIESINSPKIKIIDTIWDLEKYPKGTENAHQTDIAKNACSGDWLFYLQADEVVHEKYLEEIETACKNNLHNKNVEAFLFSYKHFWGDYWHHQVAHGWYKNEIRIVRNHPDIHSWKSAQSFRRIPNFDGKNYRQVKGTYKLNVKKLDAEIYHYGWVRPPKYMQQKRKALDTIHKSIQEVDNIYNKEENIFDYGPLKFAAKFNGTHPKVMQQWISKFNWQNQLYEKGALPTNRPKFKHEKLRYRFLTFLEQNLLNGKSIGATNNYNLVK